MRFRLMYSGRLVASNSAGNLSASDRHAAIKHEMRRQFHAQLRYLWQVNRFLREKESYPEDYGLRVEDFPSANEQRRVPLLEIVAKLHAQHGYEFVPLVRELWSLHCQLDVVLLRHDGPDNPISGGDVDNRIKTLVDALTVPTMGQLAGNEVPRKDETPFFCLMENDKLLTRLNVETDRLLRAPRGKKNMLHQQEAEALITVSVQPHTMTNFNISFAG
jgi:hypothetical protein